MHGHLANLIEEECPAIGDFKEPRTVFFGPRKGSPSMTEEFTFDKLLGQSPAVDRDQRPRSPRALLVD